MIHALWRGGGRFTLPDSTLPDGFSPQDRFVVPMSPRPVRERKTSNIWHGPSPFAHHIRGRIGAPEGMTLYVGDEAVPYSANLVGHSWRLLGDNLQVTWPGETLPEVAVAFAEVRGLLQRLDFGAAGLPAADFVRHEITVDGHTRPGLLLPAPAVASWDLSLPPGARFEGWPAIAPLPLLGLASDGARIHLSVTVGEEVHPMGSAEIEANAPFTPWRVDLSAWGGEDVTLTLRTEIGDTQDFDHVFVGAPTVWGDSVAPIRRVVVIGLDTTRPDHLGFYGYNRDTSPELDAVLATSTVFDNAWTPAPRTRPSFRSATTGRSPLDAVGAKNLGEVFQENGFATAGIVANVHLQPRFDFHRGFDEWWFDEGTKATDQVDRALDFLGRYPDRDTYLFLHFMDPHLLYRPPAHLARQFVRDPDPDLPNGFNRWQVYQWERQGLLDDRRKQHIMDLYDAELRALSQSLGRLYDQLDRMPGRSLVVLHNDHGEEFWEHGGFEHNHSLYDDVTRGILAFRSGSGQSRGRRIDAPATLADIAPTLFELTGFTDLPAVDGRSLAPLLLGGPDVPAPDRPIGIAHLRYGLEQWGVVYRGHKYVVRTSDGYEALYDLQTDPGETRNLADDRDLADWRTALGEAHHMPVARGWRIRVEVFSPDRRPFVMKLPYPATWAGIVDPESTTPTPANQAWGETPKVRPEHVGTLSLGEDRSTLTFAPAAGTVRGILTVMFEGDPSDAALLDISGVSLFRGTEGMPLVTTTGSGLWKEGGDSLHISPSTIVVPPPSEADRIRALRGRTEDAGGNRQALIELGYLTEDGDDGDGVDGDGAP